MSESVFRMLKRWWTFVDERQIDRHAASVAIFAISCKITVWAMMFAWAHPNDSAGTIAAITGPWALAQAAALKFVFDSRDKP